MNTEHLIEFKNIISDSIEKDEPSYFDFDSYLYSHSMFEDFEILERYLFDYRIKTILDIGIGISLTSWYLDKMGYDITGCDIEFENDKLNMQQSFNQKKIWNTIKDNGNGINFVGIPYNELPFKDQSFDCVVGYAVIEHVPPRYLNQWLLEIRRVLKKGGLVFIFKCPQKLALTENMGRLLKTGSHDILYTRKEINNLFGELNFEELHFKTEDFFPYFMMTNHTQEIYDKLGYFLKIMNKMVCLTPARFFAHHMEFIFQKK